MEDTVRTDGQRFGCPGCGSGLRYDIAAGRLRCDSCGRSYEMADIPDPSVGAADGMMETAEYRCPQCGAAVHTSQTAMTSFCSYCGADVILTQRLSRMMRPSQVVPFAVTREQCEEIYRKRVREARYAPEDFSAQETIGHFRPVYIPFWRYQGRTQGSGLKGSATHRHSDSRYDYTDQYSYGVAGDVSVSGVIYDASVSFEDETAQHLRFSIQHAKPFHAGYLCGFYAEAPDTQPTLYMDGLKDYARDAWSKEFDAQCEYGSAKVDFPEDGFTSDTDLVLMPVWLLAHRSGGRVVYTAVNGDTGSIICDTPISNRRFGVLAAELTALILAALLLLHFVVVLRPRLLAALCGLTAAVAHWVIARVSRDLRIRGGRENDRTWLMTHPDQKTGQIKKVKKVKGRSLGWYLPLAVTGGIVAIGMVGTGMNAYGFNDFVASLLSDHAWLPYAVQICALVFFLAAGYKRQNAVDDLLFIGRLVVMALTMAALIVATADIWFYLCSIALLVLTAISMLRLNRAHNQYVSRPVPFFGKEGEPV